MESRKHDADSMSYDLDEEYEAYVPVKKRREALLSKMTGREESKPETESEREGINGSATTLLMEAQEVKRLKAIEGRLN